MALTETAQRNREWNDIVIRSPENRKRIWFYAHREVFNFETKREGSMCTVTALLSSLEKRSNLLILWCVLHVTSKNAYFECWRILHTWRHSRKTSEGTPKRNWTSKGEAEKHNRILFWKTKTAGTHFLTKKLPALTSWQKKTYRYSRLDRKPFRNSILDRKSCRYLLIDRKTLPVLASWQKTLPELTWQKKLPVLTSCQKNPAATHFLTEKPSGTHFLTEKAAGTYLFTGKLAGTHLYTEKSVGTHFFRAATVYNVPAFALKKLILLFHSVMILLEWKQQTGSIYTELWIYNIHLIPSPPIKAPVCRSGEQCHKKSLGLHRA